MKIKICGLRQLQDIAAVNSAIPDYAGFIVEYAPSRRSVSRETLADLRDRLLPAIVPVGVFVDADPKLLVSLYDDGILNIVQLHGNEDEEYMKRLRRYAPGLCIWKAFQVRSAQDVGRAARSSADAVLLDAGQGSGHTFDWSWLEKMPREYILAGGLDAERIVEVRGMSNVQAVDLSSGVETNGSKDADKIHAAVKAAREEM